MEETRMVDPPRLLESSLEQLLQQLSSSLRKDIAAREDRLVRRIDSERKEQQTALFELRRDMTTQQTNDLAAYEDRLSRRLDGERREHKASLAELRRELSMQQEHKVQIASLRRDLSATQAALSKLAQSGLPGDSSEGKEPAGHAVSLGGAALADLRRELGTQREQLQLQAATSEAALANLRKEMLTLQGDEVRSLTDHHGRSTAELARNIQEVTAALESVANQLRGELRREAERLRQDVEQERSQNEQRAGALTMMEARAMTVSRRLEDLERKLEGVRRTAPQDAAGVGGEAGARLMDGAAATDVAALRTALDEIRLVAEGAQRDIGRLAVDLVQQRSHAEVLEATLRQNPRGGDALGAGAQVQRLVADLTKEVEHVESRLLDSLSTRLHRVEALLRSEVAACKSTLSQFSQDLTKERSERCTALADLSCRTEDASEKAERAERRVSDGWVQPPQDIGESASNLGSSMQASEPSAAAALMGSETHVALAACVGELDAELRVELSERINGVIADMRAEIAQRVGVVELQLAEVRSLPHGLDRRVEKLEAARLDLRLGALEGAQHSAVFAKAMKPSPLIDAGLLDALAESRRGSLVATSAHALETVAVGAPRVRAPPLTSEALDISRTCSMGESLDYLETSHRSLMLGESASQVASSPRGSEHFSSLEAARARLDAARRGAGLREAEVDSLQPLRGFTNAQELIEQASECVQQAAGGADWKPLISTELKDRLTGLVNQVKGTLDGSGRDEPAGDTPPRGRPAPAPGTLQSQIHALWSAPVAPSPMSSLRGGSRGSLLHATMPDHAATPGAASVGRASDSWVCATPTMEASLCSDYVGGTLRAESPRRQIAVGPVVVGPPVLRSVSISRARQVSPTRMRSQSPMRTLRQRSPSPRRALPTMPVALSTDHL